MAYPIEEGLLRDWGFHISFFFLVPFYYHQKASAYICPYFVYFFWEYCVSIPGSIITYLWAFIHDEKIVFFVYYFLLLTKFLHSFSFVYESYHIFGNFSVYCSWIPSSVLYFFCETLLSFSFSSLYKFFVFFSLLFPKLSVFNTSVLFSKFSL